eukprot:Gregarina_sp_Poly_1__7222@NODE_396_length_8945_cov_116_430728_g324_i0_p3_GENE_NODE_396_length_8945_cov_116_430728_g324_i0NODE_396_length_8945_cov_116_430728_g324_i0_p3_ORF_typecomplete_len306_score62_05Mucin/PF01456_17/0_0007SDA1/PF05285_12/2_5KCT2/PF17818_1/2_9_NODE_396_length_8945_cov_116_430728_g324_i028463763
MIALKFGALCFVLATSVDAQDTVQFHGVTCSNDCCSDIEECQKITDGETLDACLSALPSSCQVTQQFKITGATCVDKYIGAKVDSVPTLPSGFSQVAQPKITGLLVEDSSCKKYGIVADPELDLSTCAAKASVPEPNSDLPEDKIVPLSSAAEDRFEAINLDCEPAEDKVAPIITVEPIPGELSAELLALPLETGDSSEEASEETTEESGGAATDESEESTAEGNTEEGAGETTEEGESTEEGSEETSEGGGEEDTTEEGAAPGETTEEAGGETTEPTEEEGGTEEGAVGSMFLSVAALTVYAFA